MFQSTPPRGGDLVGPRGRRYKAEVSIHAPTGGRHGWSGSGGISEVGFNPRPHGGATWPAISSRMDCPRFQSTPPRGGDIAGDCRVLQRQSFQSTPPRGGDRLSGSPHRTAHRFQSTPPRGGDVGGASVSHACTDGFNPRPHGGATGVEGCGWALWIVSIHAPTGGRPAVHPGQASIKPFQSTPPRGGDKGGTGGELVLWSFNPRPHGGATWLPGWMPGATPVSIHAPTGGRPAGIVCPVSGVPVSIHAPTGGRPITSSAPGRPGQFQSTPPRGGDRLSNWIMQTPTQFQSTPPRGGDIILHFFSGC